MPAETVDEAERSAWLYLSAVAERPTVDLWDLVDDLGPLAAAHRVRSGDLPEELDRRTAARRLSVDPEALLEQGRNCGAEFLAPGDARWPALALECLDLPRRRAALRGEAVPPDLPLRPLGLWWRGPLDPHAVTAHSAAIVGTRAPTSYGRSVAADLAAGCVSEGVVVVSGGAFGIDAAAHRAALGAAGETVAVLACGVDRMYPKGNERVLTDCVERGAVVSEHPPGTWVTRYRFLDRNRLIAALSQATVVVEAAVRSGALNTARWARDLGRPVAAVPGPVTSVTSTGCHQLLRQHTDEQPVTLITRAEDVVELAGAMGQTSPPPESPSGEWDGLDDVTRRVAEALPLRGGVAVDRVVADSGVAGQEVRAALGELLLAGRVARDGQGWRRVPTSATPRCRTAGAGAQGPGQMQLPMG